MPGKRRENSFSKSDGRKSNLCFVSIGRARAPPCPGWETAFSSLHQLHSGGKRSCWDSTCMALILQPRGQSPSWAGGETLAELVRSFSFSLCRLGSWNNISAPDLIFLQVHWDFAWTQTKTCLGWIFWGTLHQLQEVMLSMALGVSGCFCKNSPSTRNVILVSGTAELNTWRTIRHWRQVCFLINSLWRCFLLFYSLFSNYFTVDLPEDHFSCRTGNRNFLMGIRTRIGLFLWSSMRVGLIIVTVFLINKVQQNFKNSLKIIFCKQGDDEMCHW